jgi:hypothetical protein
MRRYSLNSLSLSTILLTAVCQIVTKSDENVYSAGKNGIAPLSKIWLSLHMFSWKLQLLNGSEWRFSLSNWIQIGPEMCNIRVEFHFFFFTSVK